MNTIYRIYTERDIEGNGERDLGYFTGSVDQIITYCIKHNINKEYNYYAEEIDITNCENITPNIKTFVVHDNVIRILPIKGTKAERQKALAKLTDHERELLGLN